MRALRCAVLAAVLAAGTPVPVEAATGRCTRWEPLLAQHAPRGGWSVERMSAIMYRESRCLPGVRSTTRDTGLLQINDVNLAYLRTALGEPVTQATLRDPVQNVRAAAALCRFWRRAGRGCYWPWTL